MCLSCCAAARVAGGLTDKQQTKGKRSMSGGPISILIDTTIMLGDEKTKTIRPYVSIQR